MRLLDEIDISREVFDCGACWRMKHATLIARHEHVIKPLLVAYGLEFSWLGARSDEDDASEYMKALNALAEELERLPTGCFDYADWRIQEST